MPERAGVSVSPSVIRANLAELLHRHAQVPTTTAAPVADQRRRDPGAGFAYDLCAAHLAIPPAAERMSTVAIVAFLPAVSSNV